MNDRLLRLAERIRDDLSALERLIRRAEGAWHRAQQSGDDLYLDSVALNLHSFYAGLERLFELISTTIDGSLPGGANWHQVLLQQMAVENTPLRPAVISDEARETLDEYRGFRHVVRHVYTISFDPASLQKLVDKAPVVFARVRVELMAFAAFLEQQAHLNQND